MAEKPRLKESDEILNSIGKKRGRKKQPDVVQSDILPPPIVQAPQDNGEEPSSGGGFSRADTSAQQPAEEQQPAPERDNNPLDFSKYELPQATKRRGRPRKTPVQPEGAEAESEPSATEPAPPEPSPPPAQTDAPAAKSTGRRGRPAKRKEPQADTPAPPEPEQPAPTRAVIQKGEAVPEVQEYSFGDFEEQQKREQRRRAAEEAEKTRREAEEARRKAHEEAEAARREAEEARLKAQQAADEARRKAEEAAEIARREEEAAAEFARKQREIEEAIERQKAEEEAERLRLEEESRRKLIEDNDYREGVMDQLGSEFEQQFSQMFEGEPAAPDEKPWWLEERREGLGKPVRQVPELTLTPDEPTPTKEQRRAEALREAARKTTPPAPEAPAREPEPYPFEVIAPEPPKAPSLEQTPPPEPLAQEEEEPGADEFLKLFAQEVKSEEQEREEGFRETLAQKFMRERERYLKELGIAEQAEAEEPELAATPPEAPAAPAPSIVPPLGRKLDFQIQPEMHTPAGEAPPMRPVTYTRGAQVQPQTPVEPGPTDDGFLPTPATGPDGKKSAEQLLLELGQMSKQREARKAEAGKPKQFHFKFLPVEDPAEPGEASEKKPRSRMPRIVIASAAAALAIVVALAVWIVSSLDPLRNIQPGGSESAAAVEELYTAYENYNPETVRKYVDVVVKRTDLTLSNLSVQSKLVVEEEASAEGGLTLSNVVVGDYIYVNSSGVNRLDLRDVQAEKLVIKNDRQNVVVYASGSTDIGTVELHTSGTVETGGLVEQAAGVRAVALKNTADSRLSLAVNVKNAALGTFTAEGDSVVTFEDATVETMTADGSLNLTGSGHVTTLSAGLRTGAGAGDALEAYPVNIQVKGVSVGQLTFNSSANVFLYTQVDAAYVSDPMILGGNGTIANLVLNEKFGNARLAVDVSGLNIQQLTTNTEAIIYSSGSSVINKLTANKSTYALGNKVNMLVANADGVIYEREPDNRSIGPGVAPPQSKADNPNLDYSMNTVPQTSAAEGGESGEQEATPISTTCDHAQEVGGYLQGDGSRDNPFQVQTPAQLAHVSLHLDSHFAQLADIDIATDSQYASGFAMIGAGGDRFTGTYDGGGYAIRNLRIASNAESVGLFAENIGVIRNVNIVSGEISSGGKSFVGAVVGMNYQGGTVRSCSNGATISSESGNYAGGIVGYNFGGKVRDCYNTAKVSAGDAGGGIAGVNRQAGSVTNCYSIGVVVAEGDMGDVVGVNEAVVTNCYYLEGDDVEGIGFGDGNAVGKSREQFTSAQMAADLAAGDDESLWQPGDDNYEFPVLGKPKAAAISQQSAAESQAESQSSE